MLVAYLIMLREGVEAALIVGIIASYLYKTGRGHFMPAIWAGVLAAVATCAVLGLVLKAASAEFPAREQELFAAIVAIVAAGFLAWMVFWMRSAARGLLGALQASVDEALVRDRAGLALVVMAFFAVSREGLESVFFLLAAFEQASGPWVPLGALLGLATAAAFGAAITVGGVRLDLKRFFRWTGILIILVAAGLLAKAVQSFHEAGLWNGLQTTAFDLSGILPADGVIGTLLSALFGYQEAPTVGAVAVYLAFLVPALVLFLVPMPRLRLARAA